MSHPSHIPLLPRKVGKQWLRIVFSLPSVALHLCICLNNVLSEFFFLFLFPSWLRYLKLYGIYLYPYTVHLILCHYLPPSPLKHNFCPSTDFTRRDFRKEPGFRFTWPRSRYHWLAEAETSAAKANARIQEWEGSCVRIATLRFIWCPRCHLTFHFNGKKT